MKDTVNVKDVVEEDRVTTKDLTAATDTVMVKETVNVKDTVVLQHEMTAMDTEDEVVEETPMEDDEVGEAGSGTGTSKM